MDEGVWAANVWAAGVWESNVWYEGVNPEFGSGAGRKRDGRRRGFLSLLVGRG